jgi:hypothetical protein
MADKAHYKQLGLVNTNDMFKKAMAGGYAIPAYNFNNMEQLQGIIIGCAESSRSDGKSAGRRYPGGPASGSRRYL